ncbi:hypothetical protein [Pseudothauera rhizosphaerae]|uniref:Uncharacterized protein n=1 Tax=Pseudothauera rhizosphaerae TaxID=2565932 RepID=A0A4S4AM62_9RHOO|nr:hypothetical protein [Pseudothauera rhizosphaerae]THF60633.1 hypothetical protein E6O51_12685 [Pseudothauera rhizosphaerae]
MFLLTIILLAAVSPFLILLAFIRWDRHRLANEKVEPMPREKLKNGWTPKPGSDAPILIGLSAVFAVMGIHDWLWPHQPPYSGRMSWAFEIAHRFVGNHAEAVVMWAISAFLLLIVIASAKWK